MFKHGLVGHLADVQVSVEWLDLVTSDVQSNLEIYGSFYHHFLLSPHCSSLPHCEGKCFSSKSVSDNLDTPGFSMLFFVTSFSSLKSSHVCRDAFAHSPHLLCARCWKYRIGQAILAFTYHPGGQMDIYIID